MENNSLCFMFKELPAGTTAQLLRVYLSIFGEVSGLDYDPELCAATVLFSSATHPDRITAAQHRFMGMPISVARVAAPVHDAPPSSPPQHDSSPSSYQYCHNFRYVYALFNDA